MNEHIEIEFKILLTEKMFQRILNDYQNLIQKDYIQINSYFTHPILQKKKYMLRIREKNNQLEMTLKRPFQNQLLETNIMISPTTQQLFLSHQDISNEIIDILKNEGIDPQDLQQQYSLTTHRYDIPLSTGLLSLDHNQYLGKEDFELEFEVTDETKGYESFLEIIQPYQLEYIQNCPSKIKRVLDAI